MTKPIIARLHLVKTNWLYLLLFFYFIPIFFLGILKVWDLDIWFHVKSGEIIAKYGLIHHDVFSYRTEGREWFPYEWLFQIIIYKFQLIFGFGAIKQFTAFCITMMVGLMILILRLVFKLNFILSLIFGFFFFVGAFEFFAARPYMLAYNFLFINLFLILNYYFNGKNLLWLSLPVTYLWANTHGSIFLDVAFFAVYSLISLLNYLIFKDKNWLPKFKTLGIFTILTLALTILPPLGTLQYRLLWIFYQKRHLITNFIDEWTALAENPIGFIFYSANVFITLAMAAYIIFRQKLWKQIISMSPYLILIFSAYTAARNVFLGYVGMSIILGWSFSKLNFKKLLKIDIVIMSLFLITILAYSLLVYPQKRTPPRMYYPEKASEFIKKYNLSGNMFNEYGYGGYLLYHLYPEHKVFIDGRTDLYLCCELSELLEIASKKNLPDREYKKFLDRMFEQYQTSYLLLRTQKHQVLRKMARILTDDTDWNLIYWDDDSQIIAKKDGKNDELLQKFKTLAATPYNRNPYRAGMEDQAMQEYQRMQSLTDSAKTRNAIGYILLQRKQYDLAKAEFEKATQLDTEFESPYMNLAELAYKDGDLYNAISLYDKARKLAPDRGLIYIRLGQIYLERTGNKDIVRQVYEKGIKETVDDDARERLKDLLSKL